jgi:hypothetical protein
MDQSVLPSGASTPMPYPSIPLDIRVLLLEQRHAKNHVIMEDISDDQVDRVALLRSGTIPHAYHSAYDCCIAQRLATDCGDRLQLSFPRCILAETIRSSLGDKVVSGA